MGGYIATQLKDEYFSQYKYINIEMEATYYRNYYTAFYINYYNTIGSYTNESGWSNSTSYDEKISHGDNTILEKKILSNNIENVQNTTKGISLLACEGKDYKVYSLSLSKEPLAQ